MRQVGIDSVDTLLNVLRCLQLVKASELEAITQRWQADGDPRAAATELVQRGEVTNFQIDQIFKGAGDGLILGPYLLLEPLGKGGMGQVFKARHQLMDRIVAVKLIHQHLLEKPAAVARFRREIQLAAKLSHPNIVSAFDTEQVGEQHFLVMEFFDGKTLDRIVYDDGPLPVHLACEYMHQTALGLQHAFEQGLIHRDIKPSNLLVARVESPPVASGGTGFESCVIKILDLGLARIYEPEEHDSQTQITDDDALMGTPDFIAPEQARDIRKADIRSDLYSLGCTFYFLLSGQVPFPGGTAMEKALRHGLDQPEPIEELRPEAPAEIRHIVQRLTAKNPDDRYQTPAQVVEALSG